MQVFEPQHKKTNNVDSDQVLHEPGFAATEDGYRGLKFGMYEVVVLYYSSRENKGADQLHRSLVEPCHFRLIIVWTPGLNLINLMFISTLSPSTARYGINGVCGIYTW